MEVPKFCDVCEHIATFHKYFDDSVILFWDALPLIRSEIELRRPDNINKCSHTQYYRVQIEHLCDACVVKFKYDLSVL